MCGMMEIIRFCGTKSIHKSLDCENTGFLSFHLLVIVVYYDCHYHYFARSDATTIISRVGILHWWVLNDRASSGSVESIVWSKVFEFQKGFSFF